MICLVDNETKCTSSRIIIYAFREALLMFFKMLLTLQTMEGYFFFFVILEGESTKGECLKEREGTLSGKCCHGERC